MKPTNNQTPAVYLADLEFISGEYSQSFMKCVYAKSMKEAEKRLHQYLMGYYPKAEKDEEIYYYCNGEIAVKCRGIQELPDSQNEASEYVLNLLTI